MHDAEHLEDESNEEDVEDENENENDTNGSDHDNDTTDDESGLSYHSLFMLYGMAPKHLSIHRDNFRSHGNISTPQGMANLQTIY